MASHATIIVRLRFATALRAIVRALRLALEVDAETVLVLLGFAGIVGGVAAFDFRIGAVVFGALCFGILAVRIRSGNGQPR